MTFRLHPKHNLPARTKVITFSRQQHQCIANSRIDITAKQKQFQQEVADKILAFQLKAKQIQEKLQTVRLRAKSIRKISHFNHNRMKKEEGE